MSRKNIDGSKMISELHEFRREYHDDIRSLEELNFQLQARLSKIYENCDLDDFHILFETIKACASSVEEAINKLLDATVVTGQLVCKYEEYLRF